MSRIKEQHYDSDGKLILEVYYAEGEYEALQAAEQVEQSYQEALTECISNRLQAYVANGWRSEFDLIDDIAKRGLDAVIADRTAIKEQFPKPVKGE